MNKYEKRIIGQILSIAKDGRTRVLISDQCEWVERKLAEIKKLAEHLPHTPFELGDSPVTLKSVYKHTQSNNLTKLLHQIVVNYSLEIFGR